MDIFWTLSPSEKRIGFLMWGREKDTTLHIINDSWVNVSFEDECFDVVTFIYVLEHLDDPTMHWKKLPDISETVGH